MDLAAGNRRKPLTAAFVRSVKEPGKYHDGGGTGLFLRVDPNGARFWIQRLTIKGKRRELGLGPATLVSLAKAREAALENKRAVRAGRDPLREKREASAVLSFEDAARKVHELHKPSWRNEKHAADFINSLERYAFPRIGPISVADISTSDVLTVLSPIWLEKPETARRVRQRIGTVMKWAVAKGWRQDDPARDIGQALPKQARTKSQRKALPYSEVAACLDAVRESGANPTTKLALEFLVLTAARSGEVRHARWDEIELGADGRNGVWTVPAERMKMKREHRVPLSARAKELLEAARLHHDGSGHVFPGLRKGRPISDMTLSKLVKELGFDADVHGFRTSFRTWAQERTNFPREVAEAALAHAVGDKVEQAYARSDVFEKRKQLMDLWMVHLNKREGDVVELCRA
ncbi:MAG: integrase arm-type DNA-binding domain-containing protein [Roseibium sp.]|uniref:tyrosine-type recombinase/integrase n=1 Tax=Roseibium sp. TaxID=1936156 RepID=UPI0026042565|nr:site-specific integrase [Roseibium sp.]MCV0429809.1 integrase arm-type DNA-binding domain-containing protein [Roseibium sp.]